MISVTLPDGSQGQFDHTVSIFDIANDIGAGLARAALAGKVNGQLVDTRHLVEQDADKEGFLRSERSLIQTIGRAARNLNGRAILYADRITGSMKRAMDETLRRREKQVAYIQQHGITPTSVIKAIRDNLDDKQQDIKDERQHRVKVAEEQAQYASLTPKQLAKKLQQMENTMYRHAQSLEFEQAAKMGDEMAHVRTAAFGMDEN